MFSFSINSINKIFLHKHTLSDISLEFCSGEIHAILGENGAGKSTLANIITGAVKPTSGSIFINSRQVRFYSEYKARKNGIVMVHQYPLLANELTVWENIALGHENILCGMLRTKRMINKVKLLSQEWNFELDIMQKTCKLSAGERFMVEFFNAVYANPRLIILDEPCTALSASYKKIFFNKLTELAKKDIAVILITHNIDDAVTYADKISILKKSRLLKTIDNRLHKVQADTLIESMFCNDDIDCSLESHHTDSDIVHISANKTVFEIKNLNLKNQNGCFLKDINIKAKSEEITFICGQRENGLDILEDVITGMYSQKYEGNMIVNGYRIENPTPARLRKLKMSFVPSDKKYRGSNPDISVYEMLISVSKSFANKKIVQNIIDSEKIDIKVDEPVSNLSGGMLQKLIISRETGIKPRIIVLSEPTHGLDTQTSHKMWKSLRSLADYGTAVIILSTDDTFADEYSDEIYYLSDETLILSRKNHDRHGAAQNDKN